MRTITSTRSENVYKPYDDTRCAVPTMLRFSKTLWDKDVIITRNCGKDTRFLQAVGLMATPS